MTLPSWALKLAAASVIPAVIFAGAALSAPSQQVAGTVADQTYQSGDDGIDFAAVTGPVGSREGRTPACADPASGLHPCVK
ncbi:hypothetical protein FY036_13585 [Mesorhizobium microcysteis]|uniref:DUF680 domain-containing protein n=1 Tax=Neoaquamicrobium microcysteis TaxID=2682781 RepID=A0A5D4GRC7_9HYPH|nr:hypothetical protein [Mesorhizobium microcysteis]TYR31316.1 hypothetical protein FY036_13585 [Mesorhizobium microcysteis]